MEADTALIWADSAARLDTEAAVDLDLSSVVHPGDAEDDDALRFNYPFQDFLVHEVGVVHHEGGYAFHNFPHGLVELFLTGIPGYNGAHEALDVIVDEFVHKKVLLTNRILFIYLRFKCIISQI